MKRMRRLAMLLAAAVLAATAGCATHHHHHGARSVRVLEAEHSDRKIVIVTSRPARVRKCWKHGGHWHCRR